MALVSNPVLPLSLSVGSEVMKKGRFSGSYSVYGISILCIPERYTSQLYYTRFGACFSRLAVFETTVEMTGTENISNRSAVSQDQEIVLD